MKKILILTADFGYGHRSTSNAIAAALHEKYGEDCQVVIVNPLDDERTPAILREDQNYYDWMVREIPDLHKLGFQVAENRVAGSLINSTWTLMMFPILRDIVKQHQPDVIVCTFLFFQSILSALYSLEKRRIPTLTVVTDLATVNRLWFHPVVDLCLVPTQKVYDLAIEAGLPPEKVRITGIPVRPDLVRGEQDKFTLRRELNWNPELFTVLAVGSKRVEHLYDALHILNHSGFPLQLIVVAGGDDRLYRQLQETEWHVETHLFNYVAEMGPFMRAVDCILSKAGGLIVAEALACGLPILMVDVIPGQETGNAEHVISGDAGVRANDPLDVLETMCHWLEKDCQRYREQAQNARRLGRPYAAYEAADLIWAAAGP